MAFLLALLSAATYGIADFCGAIAARRATIVAVVIVSQLAGLLLLTAGLLFFPGTIVHTADLLWGAAAGVASGIGVALLYWGLSIGPMGIVAPVTAVFAVAVPVAVGFVLGERLTPVTIAGVVLAIVAIVLVGQEQREASPRSPRASRRALRIAVASGVLIGCFYVALQRTSPDAGLWPLVPARGVSITLFVAIAILTRQPVLVPRSAIRVAIAGGALDMLANALYLIAVQRGPLSVIATLASLYPASTVLLARIVLKERWSRPQRAGIVAAILATALIVGGAR